MCKSIRNKRKLICKTSTPSLTAMHWLRGRWRRVTTWEGSCSCRAWLAALARASGRAWCANPNFHNNSSNTHPSSTKFLTLVSTRCHPVHHRPSPEAPLGHSNFLIRHLMSVATEQPVDANTLESYLIDFELGVTGKKAPRILGFH